MSEVIKILHTPITPVKIVAIPLVPTKIIRIGNQLVVQTTESVPFKKILPSGLTAEVQFDEHNISSVKGVSVLDAGLREIDLSVQIQDDETVIIESNINLNNFTLKIY